MSAGELRDAIGEVIRDVIVDKLGKTDAFSNNSLAYLGLEFEWEVKMRFASRQNTDLKVEGNGRNEWPEIEIVSAKGKHSAGTLKEKAAKVAATAK
jgi:hypothetical protein